jgi:hypothetical protein
MINGVARGMTPRTGLGHRCPGTDAWSASCHVDYTERRTTGLSREGGPGPLPRESSARESLHPVLASCALWSHGLSSVGGGVSCRSRHECVEAPSIRAHKVRQPTVARGRERRSMVSEKLAHQLTSAQFRAVYVPSWPGSRAACELWHRHRARCARGRGHDPKQSQNGLLLRALMFGAFSEVTDGDDASARALHDA